jgi:hypothetical protein
MKKLIFIPTPISHTVCILDNEPTLNIFLHENGLFKDIPQGHGYVELHLLT